MARDGHLVEADLVEGDPGLEARLLPAHKSQGRALANVVPVQVETTGAASFPLASLVVERLNQDVRRGVVADLLEGDDGPAVKCIAGEAAEGGRRAEGVGAVVVDGKAVALEAFGARWRVGRAGRLCQPEEAHCQGQRNGFGSPSHAVSLLSVSTNLTGF